MGKRKSYDELTITDDFLFCKVMSNPDLCKEMIEILLDIEVDHLDCVERQHVINPDYDRHSIRLDVYVKDSDRVFDIEMQTTDKANLEKRTRYYQGLIDIDHLEHEMDYKTLKESYIIFICTFDPFNSNLIKYSVSQCLNNNINLSYNDKTNKVFYNLYGKADENFNETSTSRLRDFLKYLKTKEPTNDFTLKIDQAAQKAKFNTFWRKEYMTVNLWIEEAKEEAKKEGFETGRIAGLEAGLAEGRVEGRAEGRAEGIEEGLRQKAVETAENLLRAGVDIQTISKCVDLPLEQVNEIANNL